MSETSQRDVSGKDQRSDVVTLMNYVDALDEYLVEQLPATKAALQALDAVRLLLKDMHAGSL